MAAGEIDRHAAEKHDVHARGRKLARSAHAHLIRLIDLAPAALDHAHRRDDEGHAFGYDLVELVREDFRAQRWTRVADAGTAAIDVAATWLRKLHVHVPRPSAPATCAHQIDMTNFPADVTRKSREKDTGRGYETEPEVEQAEREIIVHYCTLGAA